MNQDALHDGQELSADDASGPDHDRTVSAPETQPSLEVDPGQSTLLQVWCRHDSFLSKALTTGKQGPPWQAVKRRRVIKSDNGGVLLDEFISPVRSKKHYHQNIPKEVVHVTTEFHFQLQEKMITTGALPVHCVRQQNLRSIVHPRIHHPRWMESRFWLSKCSALQDLYH